MSAIREIEARKFEKRFQEYEKHVPVMEKLFDKAGFHFVSDHVKIDDKGHTLASIKLHPPAQGLTAEDRAMFESAIEFGDKLRTDPKDFQDLKDNTEDSGDYYKLRLVDHSMRARELYARALVDSQKPGDLEKAFQLLSEQIKVTPDFSPSESFLDTAWLLLRIDDNPDFRKAFSDAGLDQQSIKPLLVGRMWEF